jgi:quercetin dioxygenase-like cupin family protein
MRLDEVDAGDGPSGVVRSLPSADLNVNLVVLAPGDAIAAHRNDAFDVLVVAVGGRGTVRIDGAPHELVAPSAVVVPKGTERSTAADAGEELRYLTVHPARGPLQIS